MSQFKSHRSYQKFRNAIKRQNRYVRSKEVEDFLDKVAVTAEKRTSSLAKNTFLWRAQLGHDWKPLKKKGEYIGDIECPHLPERMTPRRDRATGGRANPKGIPYLYLATNRKTALAEVRPVVGSLISVAQFRTNQTLNLVDCSSDHESSRIYLEEPEPEKREEAVWADINRAFSSPVTWSEDEADYVPTQIIAELFKSRGYGGIVYRSGLGDGHNVVFFDVDVAGLVNCSLFEADAVHFNFKQVANPYFAHSDSEN